MDIRTLKTFVYAAELGGFTRAAEALGYSQSTVSFQIKQLETELGARLFDRVRHTVTLTERGREVLRYAQEISQLAEEMEQAMHAEKPVTGTIRLAAASSLCPALQGPAFLEFREKWPGISLKIVEADTNEMFRQLNHNEADLLLTLDSHIYSAEYAIAWEQRVGAHFFAPADYPLSRKASVALSELTAEPFLLTERGMSYRRLLDEALAQRSFEIVPVLEAGDAFHLCRLVQKGAGLSFLPDYVAEEAVQNGSIARLPVPEIQIEVWKQLLYHRDKWPSPAMEAVIDYCIACEEG